MKQMNLPDGPGWSPDGGKFWVKGDVLYWEDGDVWDMTDGGVIRLAGGPFHHEDYSEWSDEKRAEVRAIHAASRKIQKVNDRARKKELKALQKSARKKLTDAEFAAVLALCE